MEGVLQRGAAFSARIARGACTAAVMAAALAADTSEASASTYCVGVGAPTCVGTTEPDLQTALTASASGANTVKLGPGTYPGSFATGASATGFSFTSAAGSTVAISGAGIGQTILLPPTGSHVSNTTLRLTGAGSSVSDMTVMRGQGSTDATGIALSDGSGAGHVAIADTVAATPSTGSGISVFDGTSTITDCFVALGATTTTVPVFVRSAGTNVSIDRCVLRGYYGAYTNASSTLKVLHSTLVNGGGAGALYGYGTMTAQDDLVVLTGPGQLGLVAFANSTASGSIAAKGVTIVGGSSDVGVSANSSAADAGHNAHITLDSSIVRGVATSLATTQGGGGASIATTYSDFSLSAASGSGIVAGTGFVDNADPGFVDPTPVTGDFHLRASSPLIDHGNPAALVLGDSTLDLDGAARVVNGRFDPGAYEYGRRAPVAAATSSPAEALIGQVVTFDASASTDPDPGDKLSYTWAFDDGATASGPVVNHVYATAGPHFATLTITDPTLQTATATAATRVSAPSATPNPIPKPAPKFSGVSFASTTLRMSTGWIAPRLTCPAATSGYCRGTLTLKATLPKIRKKTHAKARAVTVASAGFTVRPGQSKTLSLTVSRAARTVVAAKHKLKVSATADAHDVTPTRHTTARTLTITPAPKPRKHRH